MVIDYTLFSGVLFLVFGLILLWLVISFFLIKIKFFKLAFTFKKIKIKTELICISKILNNKWFCTLCKKAKKKKFSRFVSRSYNSTILSFKTIIKYIQLFYQNFKLILDLYLKLIIIFCLHGKDHERNFMLPQPNMSYGDFTWQSETRYSTV